MVPVFGRCHVTHRCHQRCVCIASVSIFCATWCLKTYETGTNQIPLKIWVQSNTFHIVPSWQKLMDEIVPIDFSTADAEWTCTTSIQNPGQEQRHSLLSEHSVSAFLGCDVNLVRIGRIDCTLRSRPACTPISHMKLAGVAQNGCIEDVALDPSKDQDASSIVKHRHLPLLNVLCAKPQQIIDWKDWIQIEYIKHAWGGSFIFMCIDPAGINLNLHKGNRLETLWRSAGWDATSRALPQER